MHSGAGRGKSTFISDVYNVGLGKYSCEFCTYFNILKSSFSVKDWHT